MYGENGITHSRSAGLVEVLDRILDKGLVVAGDIQVMLADIELLTIRVRLIVCSLDKAKELGIDWWRRDQYLSSGARSSRGRDARRSRKRDKTKKKRSKPARHGAVRAGSGLKKSAVPRRASDRR